jgi:hypothetical protein
MAADTLLRNCRAIEARLVFVRDCHDNLMMARRTGKNYQLVRQEGFTSYPVLLYTGVDSSLPCPRKP